jgi:flagellar assembly protein FliH
MRSLPKVLKASSIFVDRDNCVHIKANAPEGMKLALEEQLAGQISGSAQAMVDTFKNSGIVEEAILPPEDIANDIISNAQAQAAIILRDSERDCKFAMAKAEDEADRILEEARATIEQEAQQVREENRKLGYQEGMDSAKDEAEAIKAEANALLELCKMDCDEMRASIEPDTVNLVIDITRKLLGEAVELDPSLVVELIRNGLDGTTIKGAVSVRVAPKAYEAVVERKEELMAAAGGNAEVEIIKDLSLQPADAVIDTEIGGIDVGLDTQFDAMSEDLISLLEQSE